MTQSEKLTKGAETSNFETSSKQTIDQKTSVAAEFSESTEFGKISFEMTTDSKSTLNIVWPTREYSSMTPIFIPIQSQNK